MVSTSASPGQKPVSAQQQEHVVKRHVWFLGFLFVSTAFLVVSVMIPYMYTLDESSYGNYYTVQKGIKKTHVHKYEDVLIINKKSCGWFSLSSVASSACTL